MLAICGGLMRTGSVNMFQIMREIAESQDKGYAPIMPLNHEEEFFLEHLKEWANDTRRIVIKSHLWRNELEPYADKMKVIVTIRDMRDVVVSLMNFRNGTFESSLNSNAFKRNIVGQKEWQEKVPKKNLFVIKYEDFIHNRIAITERVADFIGVPVSRLGAFEIENKWNLSANLRRAKEGYPANSPYYMSERHISSGRDGQWKTALTEEQIAQVEETAGKNWFRSNGYKLWKD